MWNDRVDNTAAGPAAGGVSRRPSRPLRSESGRHGPIDPRHRTHVLRVDCDTCTARGWACGDCAIGVLLGPPGQVDLDADEQAALSTLADSGMVPPLRLVQSVAGPEAGSSAAGAADEESLDAAWADLDDGWGTPTGDWV